MSLQPVGLPPSAILCIRKMRDPLPGRLPLGRLGVAPPPAWREALVRDVELVARRAVRPARGPVPANAEAVLFADRAELLVCLARDWLVGIAAMRWWWRALFKGNDIAQAVRGAWLESPQFVPAALERLAADGMVTEFVRVLDTATINILVEAVVRTFGLGALRGALAPSPPTHDGSPLPAPPKGDSDRAPVIGASSTNSPVDRSQTPVTLLVPEVRRRDLSPEREALLIVALALARAPAEARSGPFAVALRAWRERRPETEVPAPRPSVSTMSPAKFEGRPMPEGGEPPAVTHSSPATGSASPRADRVPMREPSPEPPVLTATRRAPDAADSGVGGQADAFHGSQAGIEPVATGAGHLMQTVGRIPLPPPRSAEHLAPADASLRMPPSLLPEPLPEPALPVGTIVETRYGGVFYLVNAGLFLGLYGDFTCPVEPGIELSIWDFLALAGEDVAGPGLRGDPVWPLLAQLAGRGPDEPPGSRFDAPTEWRMPAEWLAPFAGRRGAWRWGHGDGRLRVLHPAGFPMLDVARDGGPAAKQVRRELLPYRAQLRFRLRRKRDAFAPAGEDSIARWRGWLMPYLRRRLALALGARSQRDVAELLVRRPARIALTTAHLDVHFPLADLPIQVRLAGLDRDPGWVPAAGRYIRFQYE